MKINKDSIKVFTKPMGMITVGAVFRNDPLDSILKGEELIEEGEEGGGGSPAPDTKTPEELAAAEAETTRLQEEADLKIKKDAEDLENAKRFEGKTEEEIAAIKAEESKGSDDDEFAKVKTDLLEKYEGASYDEEGNILDTEGNIIKKFEDFESELTTTEVPIVEELNTLLGYEFKDENGKPIKYEDSVKGLGTYVNDVASKMASQQIDEFLGAFPEVQDFYNHIELGGSKSDYFNSAMSFEDIKIEKDNKILQKQVTTEALKAKGFTDEKANEYVAMLDTAGKLFDESVSAQKELSDLKTLQTQDRIKRIQEQESINRQKAEQHWTTIESTINKGTLKDIKIPQADIKEFFNYVSKDVNGKGQSRDMLDLENEDTETRLMMSYYRFKGYTLKDMVQAMSSDTQVKNLRERFTNARKQVGEHIKPPVLHVNPNDVEINIDTIY